MRSFTACLAYLLMLSSWPGVAQSEELKDFRSHPPVRPLPEPSRRPLGDRALRLVDPKAGSDDNSGTPEAPWRTVQHAVRKLRPGQTLHLRGGIYFEHVNVSAKGEADLPITIRSYPGELAVLDGGLAEFQTSPEAAWVPVTDAGVGEYRSAKAFPQLATPELYRHEVALIGNFADSLVPLHGYRFLIDFRADNPYWTVDNKLSAETGVYCGPGLWFDHQSHHIHVRLAPTRLEQLGEENYRGEIDPRKLSLVVAGYQTPLKLAGARNLRLQDLVVRGSAGNTVEITGCEDIELDGLTVYGGAPALYIHGTARLRVDNCAIRGLTAPWSSRASHKYRGISPYLVIFSGASPQCRDVEIAWCELTDNHDGVILGTIDGLKFHHNVVENFDDDGLYVTLSRSEPPSGIHIYQNYLARCHTLFSFAESGQGVKNEVGDGVYIFRNVLDFRRGTPSAPPKDADTDRPELMADRQGRPASDHGSPYWDPILFYHNTMISHEPSPSYKGDYGMGIATHTRGSRRRVFNNIFVQTVGLPGIRLAGTMDDVQVDGNLHWGTAEGTSYAGDFFAAFRKSKVFLDSQKHYPPGWGAHDQFADPRFIHFSTDDRQPVNLGLTSGSPAVDAGVQLPNEWPDPLRAEDKREPDLGAIPFGARPWGVGVQGRMDSLLGTN